LTPFLNQTIFSGFFSQGSFGSREMRLKEVLTIMKKNVISISYGTSWEGMAVPDKHPE